MAVTIQTRRDSAADWTTANPVLALGEIGIETDTDKAKYGDGFTQWSDLEYWIGGDPLPDGVNGQTIRYGTEWEATSALVVTGAGNVGIGTTAPAAELEVAGDVRTTRSTARIQFNQTAAADLNFDMSVGAAGALAFRSQNDLFDSPVERMRIDLSGNVLVGKTSKSLATPGIELIGSSGQLNITRDTGDPVSIRRNGGDGTAIQFYVDGSASGRINLSGGAASFATGSDAALKDNIQDMGGELVSVLALRPVDYTLKESGEKASGFIAQEVQEVWPHKVTEPDDDGMLGLADMGDTTARLVKAIQELAAKVEALENA